MLNRPGLDAASVKAIAAVARQKSVGIASLCSLVVQAEIDSGDRDGQTSEDAAGIKRLRVENKWRRADVAILKAATTFFAGELSPRKR